MNALNDAKLPWWESLYDDLLADVLLVRADSEQLDQTLGFLWDVLALQPGQHVFDQCCGVGSLSVPLVERGLQVTGVDQAARYIERANHAAQNVGVGPTFVRADAFQYVPDTPCDAALNWWTSFGYMERDEDNIRMLARAYDALKPGGRYVLDTINVPGLLQRFRPEQVVTRKTVNGEIRLCRKSHLDLERSVMTQAWHYTNESGPDVTHSSVLRLYMPNDLVAMFEACGFSQVTLFGSVGGEPLELDSPRCIIVGRRSLK